MSLLVDIFDRVIKPIFGQQVSKQQADTCKICGKVPTESFRCVACGRYPICLTHYDEVYMFCQECVALAAKRAKDAPISSKHLALIRRRRLWTRAFSSTLTLMVILGLVFASGVAVEHWLLLRGLQSTTSRYLKQAKQAYEQKHYGLAAWLYQRVLDYDSRNNAASEGMNDIRYCLSPQDIFQKAEKGNADHVQAILIAYKDVADKKDNNNDSQPIHYAALSGQVTVGWLLMQYGVDINAKNRDNNTPLHLAASWGRSNFCRWLLSNKASPEAKNNKHRTPYDMARLDCHAEDRNNCRKVMAVLRNNSPGRPDAIPKIAVSPYIFKPVR